MHSHTNCMYRLYFYMKHNKELQKEKQEVSIFKIIFWIIKVFWFCLKKFIGSNTNAPLKHTSRLTRFLLALFNALNTSNWQYRVRGLKYQIILTSMIFIFLLAAFKFYNYTGFLILYMRQYINISKYLS